jgi:PPM family protein phosphatase
LRFETAEISLLGDREENQDRAAVCVRDGAVLMIVADGMGGHEGGSMAAEVAVESLRRSFLSADDQDDWHAFLRRAIASAHDEVVALGDKIGIGSRPRTTCAVCIVDDSRAIWAHVGDSRIYLARGGELLTRTRDHTPLEGLLQDGLISEEEIAGHPMRHYVEYCLGGVAEQPLISISSEMTLEAGDLLLVCSDGLWSGVPDRDIAAGPASDTALADWLARVASRAVRACTPYSDNTTATVLHALADESPAAGEDIAETE